MIVIVPARDWDLACFARCTSANSPGRECPGEPPSECVNSPDVILVVLLCVALPAAYVSHEDVAGLRPVSIIDDGARRRMRSLGFHWNVDARCSRPRFRSYGQLEEAGWRTLAGPTCKPPGRETSAVNVPARSSGLVVAVASCVAPSLRDGDRRPAERDRDLAERLSRDRRSSRPGCSRPRRSSRRASGRTCRTRRPPSGAARCVAFCDRRADAHGKDVRPLPLDAVGLFSSAAHRLDLALDEAVSRHRPSYRMLRAVGSPSVMNTTRSATGAPRLRRAFTS